MRLTNLSAFGCASAGKRFGIKQADLAKTLGVSYQQIQKYEIGKNRVSAGRLFDICKALNVSLSSMFERDPKA